MNPPNFIRSGPCLLPPHIADAARRTRAALGLPSRPAITTTSRPAPAASGISWADPRPGLLRVGMLAPCAQQGGAEAWMLALARSTGERISWAGCVVTGGEAVADPAMVQQLGRLLPVSLNPADAPALASSVDVLVVWAIDGLPAILGASTRRPRVVSVIHVPPEAPWNQSVDARPDGVDQWVAVSELAREVIPEASRTIPAATIWNAVDSERLEIRRSRAEMLESWGVPPGAKVAGFLGRLSVEKDPHAMRRMIEHLPVEWHAVLVGSGAEQVEPHERLRLVGNDPAAGDCLNAFDVLVVPSRYESFGLTIAEGLWMGTPVVSTEVGIARLRPGLTRIVPIGADGPTLATAVLTARDPERIARAREFARDRLVLDRFGREWADLLQSMGPKLTPAQRIGRCRHRGSILPLSLQSDGCGCGSRELTQCRAGKGKIAGRVTTEDCLACVAGL